MNVIPCKAIQIPESSKRFLLEYGIVRLGIQSSAWGIQKPVKIIIENPYSTNKEPKFQYLETGIHSVEPSIESKTFFDYLASEINFRKKRQKYSLFFLSSFDFSLRSKRNVGLMVLLERLQQDVRSGYEGEETVV